MDVALWVLNVELEFKGQNNNTTLTLQQVWYCIQTRMHGLKMCTVPTKRVRLKATTVVF